MSIATDKAATTAANAVDKAVDVSTNLMQKGGDIILNTVQSTIETSKVGLAKAVDIAQEQIPDIIHQFLMWKFVESIVPFIIGLIIFLVMVVSVYKFAKYMNGCSKLPKNEKPVFYIFIMEGGAIVVALIWIFGFVFSSVLMSTHTDWVKIWVAPKVYLIEYATQNIKEAVKEIKK